MKVPSKQQSKEVQRVATEVYYNKPAGETIAETCRAELEKPSDLTFKDSHFETKHNVGLKVNTKKGKRKKPLGGSFEKIDKAEIEEKSTTDSPLDNLGFSFFPVKAKLEESKREDSKIQSNTGKKSKKPKEISPNKDSNFQQKVRVEDLPPSSIILHYQKNDKSKRKSVKVAGEQQEVKEESETFNAEKEFLKKSLDFEESVEVVEKTELKEVGSTVLTKDEDFEEKSKYLDKSSVPEFDAEITVQATACNDDVGLDREIINAVEQFLKKSSDLNETVELIEKIEQKEVSHIVETIAKDDNCEKEFVVLEESSTATALVETSSDDSGLENPSEFIEETCKAQTQVSDTEINNYTANTNVELTTDDNNFFEDTASNVDADITLVDTKGIESVSPTFQANEGLNTIQIIEERTDSLPDSNFDEETELKNISTLVNCSSSSAENEDVSVSNAAINITEKNCCKLFPPFDYQEQNTNFQENQPQNPIKMNNTPQTSSEDDITKQFTDKMATDSNTEIRVLTLNANEHQDNVLYRLEQNWIIQFRLGPSLLGRKVALFCNYPIMNLDFRRNVYYEVPWKQDEGCSHSDDTALYGEIVARNPGSFHYFFIYSNE